MLSKQLDKIVTNSLASEDLKATLSTLRKIFDNIIQHPNDDKYRQIKLANKTFSSKVWRYPACEELMKMSGWVVEDDHVKLRDDSHVHIVSQLLESLYGQTDVSQLKVSSLSNKLTKYSVEEFGNIISAVVSGNISVVQNLIKPSSISIAGSIYCKDSSSTNLLFVAIVIQKMDVVELLVKQYSVDPYVADDTSIIVEDLFYFAPQNFIIKFLKFCGVKLFLNEGSTLLHIAVGTCCFQVVWFLVKECGVDVNLYDDGLNTPLHYAYCTGQTDIAHYLIQNGANVMAADCDGLTPYDYINGNTKAIAHSKLMRNHRIIHQIPGSAEQRYFIQICNMGTEIEEAVTLTMQQFPSLTEDRPTQPHHNVDYASFTKELTQFITKRSSTDQPWRSMKPEQIRSLRFTI